MVLFLQGLAHWMEHFLTALVTQLISLLSFRTCNLTSALHEHQFEKLSFERESFRCRCQCARLFREIGFALRAFQHENSMSAPRASQMDQIARRTVVILIAAH